MISSTLDIKNLAEAFQAFCIGIATIFSVFKYLPEIFSNYKKSKIISGYQKQYPVTQLGKKFLLVRDPHRIPETHVYVIDKTTNTKRHVENPQTMRDLNFDWGDVKDISPEDYDSYSPDKKIDTKMD